MKYSKYLKNNEEPIRLIRQHPLVFLKSGLVSIILLLLPFFLMFLLFKWEVIGLVLFFILLVVGIIAVVRLIVMWSNNVFLITSHRVILSRQFGLFNKRVSEAEHGTIQDISYRIKGAGQTVFRYGSVRLQIAETKTPIIVSKIPKPRNIQQLLLRIKKNESASEND